MAQELNFWLIGGGLGLGALFGLIVQGSRFCALAAISNWVLMRDLRQMHGYLAAVAVAVIGTAALELTGIVPVGESFYRGPRINWLGTLAGGALFGFGVALAGGCAGRLLVRGAEGSVGALLAMVAVGIGAATCAYGVLAPIRSTLADATAIAVISGDISVTALLGLPAWLAPTVVALGCALAIALAVRRHASAGMVLAGALIGTLVVMGWGVTGYLSRDEFDMSVARPASLAFAGPLAQITRYVASGEMMGSLFPVALVVGGLLGAFASALARGQFRWVVPSAHEITRVVLGGSLMGVGAVFAGGCNIGQGLTGMSTLSVSALLAVGAMVFGMRLGLAWLLRAEQSPTRRHDFSARGWNAIHRRITKDVREFLAAALRLPASNR
jgi:uncharacterized membrane protein YedE/YeeE